MGKLLVKEKDIVVPGEELAEGMDFLPMGGAFRESDKIIASQVGLSVVNGRIIKVIPFSGCYIPKRDDIVIGRITDVGYSNWFVDVGYAYEASLSVKDATSDFVERGGDITKYFDLGDYIVTKITNVTKAKAIDITMKGPGLRKLVGGILINIPPPKVPRVVGKQGSMINMIKNMTGCQVIAGQNGRVWISGESVEKERVAVEAVRIIDRDAHMAGLTDKIKDFLSKAKEKENVL